MIFFFGFEFIFGISVVFRFTLQFKIVDTGSFNSELAFLRKINIRPVFFCFPSNFIIIFWARSYFHTTRPFCENK